MKLIEESDSLSIYTTNSFFMEALQNSQTNVFNWTEKKNVCNMIIINDHDNHEQLN